MEPTLERRKVERLALRWPIKLWKKGDARIVESVTSDLSCAGFYCTSNYAFLPGEALECAIQIADQSRKTARTWTIHCMAIVLRVEAKTPESGYGIACRFDDYTVLGGFSDFNAAQTEA
jgi:hypothetical protein